MANVDTEVGTHKSSSPSGTDMKAEARETASEIRQDVQRLKEEAKQRGESFFKGQRSAAADEVGGMADALHRTARQLNERDQSTTAHYVDRAAEALDKMVDTLREGDLRSMLRKTEDFARRNPGVFFGASVLTGVVLSRFLKSSAERKETESRYRSEERMGTGYSH